MQFHADGRAGSNNPGDTMPTYTTSSSNGDVLLSGKMPEAEYMYGCVPTAMAMLLGYYDLYGYQGKDLSKIVDGKVALKSRGTDGNAYDMDAFDTVLGKLTASKEYVYRFYARDGVETTPEQELVYTFQDDNKTLKTDEWNCLADYLGTGQFWRGADNLVSLVSYCTLADLYNNHYSDVRITDGSTTRMVRYNDTTILPGLDLYVQSRGYQLDYEITGTFQVDVAGGSFTFNDYMKEIDSGRPVLISIQEHVMIGYGYNKKTQEIIFDDCYKVDQRMKWGGTYFYADADRRLESITVIGFNMNGDVDLALVNTKNSSEKLVLNATAGGTGSDDYCVAGKGNTVYLTYSVSNLGKKRSGKFQASIYVDGNLVSVSTLDSLSMNETREIPVSLGKITVGTHNVRVVLDESNAIQEVNGANNEEKRSFLILKSGTEVVTGNRQVAQGETAADLYMHGGTLALNGGTASGVVLRGTSGGNSFWGARYQNGRANVSQGGCLSGADVYDHGEVNVSGGGIATSVHLMSAGRLTVRGNGAVSDVTVESGGRATVESDGKLTGKIRISSGASVSVGAGGILDFDVSALSPGAGARVNVLSRISGAPVYTLTVSGTQTLGSYTLAGGAAKFNGTISVRNTEDVVFGELKLKKTLAISHAAYKLKLDGEYLVLTVTANKPPTVSKIKADITNPTSRDVNVTAVFKDDVGLAASLYKIGEDGEWTAYGKKGVTVSENATVYFKAVDIGGNESEIGVCEVTNIDKSVVDAGGNNWLYDKSFPEPNPDENLVTNPLYDGVSDILLDQAGTVSKDGKQNFVGYGDPADYAKITFDSPSKLSFTVNSSDKVKFVVYALAESTNSKGDPAYKLKALQTTVSVKDKKTGEYAATTKSLLLDPADANTAYYISVQSTNATKNGFALYNVALNPDDTKTEFYADGDDGDNDWLYDKKLKSRGEAALNGKVTESEAVKISAAGDEIRFDTDPVCEDAQAEGWNNFVGFGDAADYVKIRLETAAELTFMIESTDKAKLTVYRIDSKTDKTGKITYSLKSLNARTLRKENDSTVYTAETKMLLLDADTDYYLSVQSTNAKKGGSAHYSVTVGNWLETVPAEAKDACPLTSPEDTMNLPVSLLRQDSGLLA